MAAVVLLPPLRGRLGDHKLLRWLSQSQLEQVPVPVDPLAQVLGALGLERPVEGLAALRMWGQTGDRPGTWVAAGTRFTWSHSSIDSCCMYSVPVM